MAIGVIGLGVMGKNLALNIADNGFRVHVYNRTVTKSKELECESSNVYGFCDFYEFVHSLQSPKKILLMVTAGKPVDDLLERLRPLLSAEDIVIDGGNSYYLDTIRREKECKFNFVGCGISGGEYGARYGPAMFFGCKKEVYDNIKEIFEKISAKTIEDGSSSTKTCCGWMGKDGAGHFVKAVHNGIEYCIMQTLQELMNVLHFQCKDKYEFIQEVFKELNTGITRGYLVEICENILKTVDINGRLVLEQIVDKAEQKGTGKMCIFSGIENDVIINGITESVFARYMSSQKDRRENFHKAVHGEGSIENDKKDLSPPSIDTFKKAFHLALAINFIQGSDLLIANKKKYDWNFTIEEVCDVWRNGCILRCEFLTELKEMGKSGCLETTETFLKNYKENIGSLKEICKFSIENEIYSPVLQSSLNWIYGLNQNERNGTMIQAMRDYFGRHGVILKSGEEKSIKWG